MTFRMQDQKIAEQKNSWYLKTGQVHHFLCLCGQEDKSVDLIILINIYHPDHCCSHCGNTHYLDSVMFLNKPKVVRWSKFYWNMENIRTEEGWIVKAYDYIPLFNNSLQKIELKKITIGTNRLFFTGKHEYHEDNQMIMKKYVYNDSPKAALIKTLIAEELEEKLYASVLSSPIEGLSWINSESLSNLSTPERIKLFTFFLKNDHLKEYDFFYWDNFEIFKKISRQYPSLKKMLSYISNHRKEKSIMRAHYESYIESMKIHSRYNLMTDYIFAHHIEDRNHLLKLIRMDTEVKHILFDEIPMVTIEKFLWFLEEHYTEKAITELFTVLDKNTFRYHNIVRDTLWMCVGEGMDFIREHFIKVPLNFQRLHDEFIRINTMRNAELRGKVKFEYQENDLNAQRKKDLFEYRLPETTTVLQLWSRQLHNCMYGYSSSIHQGHTIIYGVFKDDTLTYAVEIRGNKIVQALGKYNRHIEDIDREKIDTWYQDVYIAGWMSGS